MTDILKLLREKKNTNLILKDVMQNVVSIFLFCLELCVVIEKTRNGGQLESKSFDICLIWQRFMLGLETVLM